MLACFVFFAGFSITSSFIGDVSEALLLFLELVLFTSSTTTDVVASSATGRGDCITTDSAGAIGFPLITALSLSFL